MKNTQSFSKKDDASIHVPPHSEEAEVSILGALLLDKDAIIAVAEFLKSNHFYDDRHKEIYETIVNLYEERSPIDVLTVAERLKKRKSLKRVGGTAYLQELLSRVPTAAHVEHYGKIVKDAATKRSLMQKATRLVDLSFDESIDADELLDKAESEIFSLTQTHLTGSFTPVRAALADSFDRLDELHKLGNGLRGVPTGFPDIDNLLAGLQKSNLVILAARPGVGKCVTGDTLVIDPITGQRNKIEELVKDKKGQVLSLNKNLKLQSSSPSAFVADGVKEVYEVKTSLGNTLKATAVHPLLTINGWEKLEALKPGDRIATPRKLDFFGRKDMEDYKIKCLAYLLGDGGLTGNVPIFTNKNERLLNDITRAASHFPNIKVVRRKVLDRAPNVAIISADKYFLSLRKEFSLSFQEFLAKMRFSQRQLALAIGVSPALVNLWNSGLALPSKDTSAKLKKVWTEVPLIEINTNSVTKWLKELGVMGELSIKKQIPSVIFELKKKKIALLLNRLYACEGSVILKGNHLRISFASSSKEMAEQVKHLLLRFGIIARLRTKKVNYKEEKKIAYEVEILDSTGISIFAKEIGIFGKERKLKQAQIIAQSQITTKNWTKDNLPLDIWQLILKEKGELSWRKVYKLMGKPLSHNIHVNKRQLRRETLFEIAKALNSSILLTFAVSDIYWDKIVNITPVGLKPVYDLAVDKVHNFVANDIVVHNTSLALNIAQNLAVNEKRSVGMFSLEMSKEELLDRLLTAQADIDAWKLKTGKLSEDDFTKLSNAMGELAEAPFYIDDTPALSILEMRTKARRLQVEFGIDLLIIDYLQLARSRNLENRVQEVSEISQGFKNLARELKIPILALSQLSRSVESRGVKRPQLSDLRESGCLSGDTLIINAFTGKRETIKSLVGKNSFMTYSVTDNLKLSQAKVSKVFSSGKKVIYKLTLRSGKTIKASANHPFMKVSGWESLEDLHVGDKIAAVHGGEKTTDLAHSNIYWDEIKSIETLGEEEVYDMTIPKYANFVANNIIVHNSIEQDADVVMFLWREDEEDVAPGKPINITLDIAKHRNGPLGNVKLSFHGDRIKFYPRESKRTK